MKLQQIDEQTLLNVTAKIQSALSVLKEEFFGIDEQLQHLLRLIQPFLIDPSQFKDRPLIINLWGMTGVGKSEVIKRALQLLKLDGNAAFFDMGEYTSAYGGYDLKDKLCDLHDATEPNQGAILIFDEIQHIKTLDEKKTEVSNPVGRVLWEVLDKGTVTQATFSRYYQRQVKIFVQRLEHCVLMKGLKIENNKIVHSESDWHTAAAGSRWVSKGTKEDDEEEIGVGGTIITAGFAFFLAGAFSQYFRDTIPGSEWFLETVGNDDGWQSGKAQAEDSLEMDWFNNQFCGSEAMKTGESIIEWLKGILDAATLQVQHSFNPLCVVVIGNLDEAYDMSNDVEESVSIDEVYQRSLTVSLHNVKQALLQRFRAEQVARLGHNHVIYPALNAQAYRKIIRQQISEAEIRHTQIYGVPVQYTTAVEDLIFYEVVSPTQGARCVMSGTSALLDSYYPSIALEYMKRQCSGGLKIGFSESKEAFRVSAGDETWYQPVMLQVRTRKSAVNSGTIYKTAVHEAAHAIVMAATEGEPPTQLNCVYTLEKQGSATEKFGYRGSRDEQIEWIAVLLAGLEGEKMIFGENLAGDGAGSDYRKATALALSMVGECGLGSTFRGRTRQPVSAGSGQYVFTGEDAMLDMEEDAEHLLDEARKMAREILQQNHQTLVQLALTLVRLKRMNDREIIAFFKQHPIDWESSTPDYKKILESLVIQAPGKSNDVQVSPIPDPVGGLV